MLPALPMLLGEALCTGLEKPVDMIPPSNDECCQPRQHRTAKTDGHSCM